MLYWENTYENLSRNLNIFLNVTNIFSALHE